MAKDGAAGLGVKPGLDPEVPGFAPAPAPTLALAANTTNTTKGGSPRPILRQGPATLWIQLTPLWQFCYAL